jgi:hypothetical protein
MPLRKVWKLPMRSWPEPVMMIATSDVLLGTLSVSDDAEARSEPWMVKASEDDDDDDTVSVMALLDEMLAAVPPAEQSEAA